MPLRPQSARDNEAPIDDEEVFGGNALWKGKLEGTIDVTYTFGAQLPAVP